MNKKARVIAMYLPQYHPIPLNDEWWGPGFTEWTNVASARPLFRGHYQPRIPANLGFYDLRLSETREEQARLAKEAGIEGFMYWHYWFGKGKQLLERPFNEVLESGKPDFPFCLGWANHSWSKKTWTAKNGGDVKSKLVEQTYLEDEFVDHFYDVLPAFKDSRYIKVDGKPFFLIYNVLDMPSPKVFMDAWNDLAIKNGLNGIHFVGNIMGHKAEEREDEVFTSGVNATVLSNLFHAETKCNGKISAYWKKAKTRLLKIGPEKYAYKDIIRNYHRDIEEREDIYPCVYPQLDRTPRAGKDATVYTNSTPELFGEFLQEAINRVSHKEPEHRFVVINAWNEWGEGNYLEPDQRFGKGYLDVVKKVLSE